jgi:hypothetical protein
MKIIDNQLTKHMKKMILFIAILFFSGMAIAQPPTGDAKTGDIFGQKITANGAISLEQFSTRLKEGQIIPAKIKGVVTGVCTKKGCWMKMELPDKTKMQVVFKDYGFFVPAAILGKTVVLQGEGRQKIISVNELKHYAEDAKKSKEEIDAITKPEKQVKFTATGVLVVS